MAVTAATIVALMILIAHNFKDLTLSAMIDKGNTVANFVEAAISTHMETDVSAKEHYKNRIKLLSDVINLRIIHSKNVSEQFSIPFNEDAFKDPVIAKTFKDKKPNYELTQWKKENKEMFRVTLPFVAKNTKEVNCLQCHNVELNSVIGAVDFYIDVTDYKYQAVFYLYIILGILFFILLAILYTMFNIIDRHVKNPLDRLIKDAKSSYYLHKSINTASFDSVELEDIAHKVNLFNQEIMARNAELEKQLVENQKQKEIIFLSSKKAAMGELIGIIAHQLKQPLNVINLSTALIVEDFEANELTKETLREFETRVSRNIHFMSSSIDDLRNFFRPDKKAESYSLKKAIDKAVSILSVAISNRGIELQIESEKDIEIHGFENELQQVILNILNNAKEVLIEKAIQDPKIVLKMEEKENSAVITIEDNGGGIPEDIIDKVFDSYFTTKGEKGTGIGLNLSKMIVEDSMGGKISVINSENGALFTIELPIRINY